MVPVWKESFVILRATHGPTSLKVKEMQSRKATYAAQ